MSARDAIAKAMNDAGLVSVQDDDADFIMAALTLDGYRILAPGEMDRINAEERERGRIEGIEAAAKVADEADAYWNAVAYDRRQSGRDDNFACASASSATRISTAIRALGGGEG